MQRPKGPGRHEGPRPADHTHPNERPDYAEPAHPSGASRSAHAKARPRRPIAAAILLPAVILLVAAAVAVFAIPACEDPDAGAGHGTSEEHAQEQAVATFTPDPSACDAIPAAEDGVTTFSLATADGVPEQAPALTDEQRAAIEAPLSRIEEDTDKVGFVMLDLDTGRGIAFHTDSDAYGASTFKGPYSIYVCETAGETGPSQSARDLIEEAVVWSDNDAYRTLRAAHDGGALNDWVRACGVDPEKTYWRFPTYSPRDSAKLWIHGYSYLTAEGEVNDWLESKFRATETSFIRDGIETVNVFIEEPPEVGLVNKAGWSTDEGKFNGVCDAGVIEVDGSRYLVSIMTGLTDSEGHEHDVADLAAVLFSLRTVLDGRDAASAAQVIPFDSEKYAAIVLTDKTVNAAVDYAEDIVESTLSN